MNINKIYNNLVNFCNDYIMEIKNSTRRIRPCDYDDFLNDKKTSFERELEWFDGKQIKRLKEKIKNIGIDLINPHVWIYDNYGTLYVKFGDCAIVLAMYTDTLSDSDIFLSNPIHIFFINMETEKKIHVNEFLDMAKKFIKEEMKKYKTGHTLGITHAGVFHADDVFSAAILRILNPDIEFERVLHIPNNITDDTIIFDIGFGHYDHHQKDVEVRENGVKYASFGLLWREFGQLLVSDTNVAAFDKAFVQSLDDADNGRVVNAIYQVISSFVPNWDDEDQNMDEAFFRAVSFAVEILQREIARMNAVERANKLVQTALDNSDGEIVILDRFVPWQDTLIPSTAKFVVFPSLRGGYSAQAVPSTMGGRDQKVPFPAEWAGAESTILPGLTFCHPGCFMIGADTVDTAVKACKIALQ